MKLQDVSVPRPLTHDLLGKVIGDLGGSVSSIIVSDLQNDTFFAKIMLDANGSSITIDSRPSDALALAVRVNVPIFAEEAVLSKAAIFLDKETGKTITAAETRLAEGRAGGEMDEEEVKRLSAFKDFIDTLDLSDLGKEERSKQEDEGKEKKEGDADADK